MDLKECEDKTSYITLLLHAGLVIGIVGCMSLVIDCLHQMITSNPYLLPLLNEGVVLGDSFQRQLVHQVDLIWVL